LSRIYISPDKPLRPKIIPVMDVYDIPHLTDEESARYRELKTIVKNIKAHENSTNGNYRQYRKFLQNSA